MVDAGDTNTITKPGRNTQAQNKFTMAIKRTLTDNVNLSVQILSAILYAFVLAGLNIDPNATATDIIAAIKAQSLPLILTVLFNLGTMIWMWVRNWPKSRPEFWAFFTSRSWLISVANIIIPALALIGVVLPLETATKLIDDGLAGNWTSFISTLIITIVGIIGTWLKPKLKAQTVSMNKYPAEDRKAA